MKAAAKLHDSIPPHGFVEQIPMSLEFPKHCLPNPVGCGFEHVLCLLLSPPLQLIEQELQGDQGDQPPSFVEESFRNKAER